MNNNTQYYHKITVAHWYHFQLFSSLLLFPPVFLMIFCLRNFFFLFTRLFFSFTRLFFIYATFFFILFTRLFFSFTRLFFVYATFFHFVYATFFLLFSSTNFRHLHAPLSRTSRCCCQLSL